MRHRPGAPRIKGRIHAAPRIVRDLESDIGTDVDRELRALGFVVTRFSQPRATMQTVGIPDRYVVHPAWSLRFWLELKRPGGKLSADQEAWIAAERAAGGIVLVTTGAADAVEQIAQLRKGRTP